MTFEHPHQGHKEDVCLIRSASLWMNVKPRRGKKLDEWSRCIPDSSRFLLTDRHCHVWNRQVNSGIASLASQLNAQTQKVVWRKQWVYLHRLNWTLKEIYFWVQMCVPEGVRWCGEQTISLTAVKSCYWLNVPGWEEKQPNLPRISAGLTL